MPVSEDELSAWLDEAAIDNKPGVYVIGLIAERITLYSQQVRALRLVHALSELGMLEEDVVRNIAVVGGGAAGCTAACALASLGRRVDLFETQGQLVTRNAGDRPLDPHLFDWPAPDSMREDAGLPLLDWSSAAANDVAGTLRQKVGNFTGPNKVIHRANVSVEGMAQNGARWDLTFKEYNVGDGGNRIAGGAKTEIFDLVIVASGFGSEKVIAGTNLLSYWSDNRPDTAPGMRTFISGNGDGGLIDLCLTAMGRRDQSKLMQEFLTKLRLPEDGGGENKLIKTIGEIQSKLEEEAVEAMAVLDEHLMPLLKERGVFQWVSGGVEAANNAIVYCYRNNPIPAKKGALLSKIMAYTVIRALEAQKPSLIQRAEGTVARYEPAANRVTLEDGSTLDDIHSCVARHGPDIENALAWLGLTSEALQQRWHDWRDQPDNDAIPKLHHCTYNFFHERVRGAHGQREWADEDPGSTASILIDPVNHTVLWRGANKPVDFVQMPHDRGPKIQVDIDYKDCPDRWRGLVLRVAKSDNPLVGVMVHAKGGGWTKLAPQQVSVLAEGVRLSPYVSETVCNDDINGHEQKATHHLDQKFIDRLFDIFDTKVTANNQTLDHTPIGTVTISDPLWTHLKEQIGNWKQSLQAGGRHDLRRGFLSLMDGLIGKELKTSGPALSEELIHKTLASICFTLSATMSDNTSLETSAEKSSNAAILIPGNSKLEVLLCHISQAGEINEQDSTSSIFVAPMSLTTSVPEIPLDQAVGDVETIDNVGQGPTLRIAGSEANWRAFQEGTLSEHIAQQVADHEAALREYRGQA